MKFLIVGLGNIGKEYQHTRHNIGFEILDRFAEGSGIFFKDGRLGETAQAKYKGRQLILLKPSTFMNLSGKAVAYWLLEENIPLDRLLVITDDLALPFGKIRLRSKGSDGGHNGLKHISEVLGTAAYSRLRFGIGKEFSQGQQVDYVLEQWNREEADNLAGCINICIEAIKSFAFIGIDKTMSGFNSK